MTNKNRILLKISGEALMGNTQFGLDESSEDCVFIELIP